MEDFFDDAAALGDRRQIRSYCFQEAVMVEKVGLVKFDLTVSKRP